MDKFSKNEELLAAFKDLSSPTVYAIADASNPDYKIVYLVQENKNTLRQVSKVEQMLLGWNDGVSLLRMGQTVREDIFNNLGIEVGYQFKDFYINAFETIEPAYYGQEPVKDSKGKIKLINGQLVYEHTSLIYGDKEESLKNDQRIRESHESISKIKLPEHYKELGKLVKKAVNNLDVSDLDNETKAKVKSMKEDLSKFDLSEEPNYEASALPPLDAQEIDVVDTYSPIDPLPEVTMDKASESKMETLRESLLQSPEETTTTIKPSKVFSLLDDPA